MTEPPPTLAAERTHLAWRRTAIGLTGGGVAAAHLLQEFLGAAAWSLAATALVIAVALAVVSHRRHLVGGARSTVDGHDPSSRSSCCAAPEVRARGRSRRGR